MIWLSVLGSLFYYCSLPITTLLHYLIIPLAPLQHLTSYILAAFLWPFTLIARFETLYIYLGVAALIGLITGSILHLSSAFLVSIFDLKFVPEGRGRTAASVRADKKREKLEQVWHDAPLKDEDGLKQYEGWSDQTSRRGDDYGLLGQTILEEDDSEDDF